MNNIEIAEAINSVNVFEMAQKTLYAPTTLTNDEKNVISQLDPYIKNIGEGRDPNCEIATFIQRSIVEETFNAPNDILDLMFDRGTIGEFDAREDTVMAKNNLEAYEAAKGGVVPRSYLDISRLAPATKNLQVETDISYVDIRKNGWKSIAVLVEYANVALQNKMFKILFGIIDDSILANAENYINETSMAPTVASLDEMALYIADRTNNGMIVGLTKYIQKANKLSATSNELINELHRTGKLGHYNGIPLMGISGANKLADGSTQIPENRMFGIAGKIGTLDMLGDVHVYQNTNNQNGSYHLMISDFAFAYAFNKDTLDKVCKMVIADKT